MNIIILKNYRGLVVRTNNRCTKTKEKITQAYCKRKSSIHNRKREEINREELQKQLENNKVASKCITINNYFKCQWTNWSRQWTNCSHQRTEWLIGLKKNRTHLYAAYRILPSEIKIPTD